MDIKINSNGIWTKIKTTLINIGGTWTNVKSGLINIGGVWSQFFSSSLNIQNQVTISQSTNGTTYLITLTGTNYYWSPTPTSLNYVFEWSTNNSTWTTISSGTATNPSSGSSNIVTYTLTQNDLTAGATNYYRFTVNATSGSGSGNSTSNLTSVYIPGRPTITIGTVTSNSIALSWVQTTTDFFATNRYIVWYYDPVSASYVYAANGAGGFGASTNGGSTTITNLISGQTYTIFVTPVTGYTGTTMSNYTGYAGITDFRNQATLVSPPTITMGANTGITTSGATIHWSSTNQSYAYVDSLYVGNVNSYTFTFLSSGTTYSGTVTVYSSTGATASASYSFTTQAASSPPTSVSVSGNNALPVGGTFTWSSNGSPAPTYRFVIGYNASTSAGPFTTKYDSGTGRTETSWRPYYDSGWAGAGYYRCTVFATNSAGSASGSAVVYMS